MLALPWFKHLLPLPPIKAGLISAETPIAATQVLLRERPPGPIFNELELRQLSDLGGPAGLPGLC